MNQSLFTIDLKYLTHNIMQVISDKNYTYACKAHFNVLKTRLFLNGPPKMSTR